MRWMRAVMYLVSSGTASKKKYGLSPKITYELQKDFFQSSEPDIFLAILLLERLEPDLEEAFRRSSRLVAYVPHLGPHRYPGKNAINQGAHQRPCPVRRRREVLLASPKRNSPRWVG